MSPPQDVSCKPHCKKKSKRSKKEVQFSTSVSLRYYFEDRGSNEGRPNPLIAQAKETRSISPWLPKDEVEKTKKRAKAYSKLHFRIRSKNEKANRRDSHAIANVTRYEINGESLRGMEHVTDVVNGKKRQRVQDEAISAVIAEQQKQLVHNIMKGVADKLVDGRNNSLDITDPSVVEQVKSHAVRMDSSKLAKVYASKTREALVYAKSIAEEDAIVASEILGNNSNGHASNTTSCRGMDIEAAVTNSDNQRDLTVKIRRSFLSKDSSRHLSITSKQA